MRGQIFSIELLIYVFVIVYLLFSFRDIIWRYSVILFEKERKLINKLILEYKVSDMLRKWTINPNQIDLNKVNFSDYNDLEIEIHLSDGTEISNGVNLNCDEKYSLIRILLERNDRIAVMVVKRCGG